MNLKNEKEKTFQFSAVNSALDFFNKISKDKESTEFWIDNFGDYSIYEQEFGDYLGTVKEALENPQKSSFYEHNNLSEIFYNEKTYWESGYITNERMLELALEYIEELESDIEHYSEK